MLDEDSYKKSDIKKKDSRRNEKEILIKDMSEQRRLEENRR